MMGMNQMMIWIGIGIIVLILLWLGYQRGYFAVIMNWFKKINLIKEKRKQQVTEEIEEQKKKIEEDGEKIKNDVEKKVEEAKKTLEEEKKKQHEAIDNEEEPKEGGLNWSPNYTYNQYGHPSMPDPIVKKPHKYPSNRYFRM
jgi:predicted Holliday junction resolvase-like endonuclease